MRVSVNLATRPFIELRPLFAKLRLVAIGLAVLAIIFVFTLRSLRTRLASAEAQMNALKTKTVEYQQERQRNEARMRQPQNMAILERSQFLNMLFLRKGFSWTSVMMDLERVLPAGIQVTSIDPTTSKTGEVSIRMRVSGDRDRAVELVRNLEHSRRFVSPRLSSEQMQAQESRGSIQPAAAPGAVEFDIVSGYNPLPQETKASKGGSSVAAEKKASDDTTVPQTVSRRTRGAKSAPPAQRHLVAPGHPVVPGHPSAPAPLAAPGGVR